MTVRQKNGSETDEYFTTTTVNWGWGEREQKHKSEQSSLSDQATREITLLVRLHKNLYGKAWKNKVEEL